MSSVYESLDYREVIEELSEANRISYRMVSGQAGIHPSYFSRVMVGRADFSADQIHRIAGVFGLKAEEIDYLLLLRDYSAAADHRFKAYIKGKIEAFRAEKTKLAKQLKPGGAKSLTSEERIRIYYEDALTARIHMYATVPRYQADFSLVARRLGISERRLNEEVNKLKLLGLVTSMEGKIRATEDFLHLDEDHAASPQNHVNWRLEAIGRLKARDRKLSDYHLSVCFSANEETKFRVRELFKNFVVEAGKVVAENEDAQDVFFMNFDLL